MDKTLSELLAVAEDIRRLVIFSLLNSGASQEKIAKALGVNQATVSRLLSSGTQTKKPKK